MIKPTIQHEILHDIVLTLCQDNDGLSILQDRYDDKTLAKYLDYANDSGLVSADFTCMMGGDSYVFDSCKPLPKGYAYVQQDDGIYDKLNTVTINFNEQTLKAILIANVSDSDMSDNDKNTLIAHIKALPKEALTTLSNRLVEEAFNTMPTLARFLLRLVTGVES